MARTFQRARSDEQRALRSQTILETASAMLDEMPVADISLNELSRRVGLAKSNVLRYFDSREAVLLELLDGSVGEWIAHLEAALPSAVERGAGLHRRAEQLAGAIASSLAERPVLCDLIAAQAAVLEHNVSVDAVTRHKLAGLAHAEAVSGLVRETLPELGEEGAWRYLLAIWLMTSALWAYSRPPEAVLQAHAADERLARMELDFRGALEDYLTTVAIGLHSRGRDDR